MIDPRRSIFRSGRAGPPPTSPRWGFSLVALVALVASGPSHAETYYVSNTGSDGNSGLSGSPWETLQHAADEVVAGDTVIVEAGTYRGFDLRTSGTSSEPITFSAESGVVIDQDNPVTEDGINVEEVEYVVIEGFEIHGVSRAGIRAAVCDHVTIRDNIARDNGTWGIFTGFCDHLLIEDNDCSGSIDEHGIYVSNSGDWPTIRGNLLWSNNSNGIHMNGDVSMGDDGIISEALVEANIIFDNGTGGGSGINCDGVQDSVIRNNLLFGNHASGISLYRIDGGGGASGNLVVNNTVVNADDARWALNIQDGSTDNTAYNNILYNNHSYRGSISISPDSLSGFVSDHNVVMERFTLDDGDSVMDLAQWRSDTGQDANSIVAVPADLFEDYPGDDYHLSDTSPAIDAGTTDQAPDEDLEGNVRPAGDGVDIGAYEWGSSPADDDDDDDATDDDDASDDDDVADDDTASDDDDGGPPGDDDDDGAGGCDCALAASVTAGGATPALILGLLAAWRRRR